MSPGKNLVVVARPGSTWYVGIVVLDSDYAFTVTNVLVHGIPYLALVWMYGRGRFARRRRPRRAASSGPRGWPLYLAPLAAAGLAARSGAGTALVWHERPASFPGADLRPGAAALALLVPLLALPQATHYVLDAWIWRARDNPDLARHLGF